MTTLLNKRLKLVGVDRSREAECCAPGGARTSSLTLAPASFARSLSAIR